MRHFHGAVAQLVEHHVRNVGVRGSNPLRSTIPLGCPHTSGRGYHLGLLLAREHILCNITRGFTEAWGGCETVAD